MTIKKISKKDTNYEPTAADLREEYTISNTAGFIKEFRQTFLRWVREQKGLSISEASKECKVTVDDLDRIERGKIHESDLLNLQNLSKFYGLPFTYLLALFKLAKRPQKASEFKLAAHHDVHIDEDTQKQIVEFILKLKDAK